MSVRAQITERPSLNSGTGVDASAAIAELVDRGEAVRAV